MACPMRDYIESKTCEEFHAYTIDLKLYWKKKYKKALKKEILQQMFTGFCL